MRHIRLFSTARSLWHENPLGLPKASKTPPNLAARMRRGLPKKAPLPNVRKIVAVSSAKGGVGKSTIAANLALSFARKGLRTGILDTDLFGPSIPSLFDLSGEPRLTDSGSLIPLTNYGVATMSMGYLIGGNVASGSVSGSSSATDEAPAPVVWRGLMLNQALGQLLHSTAWPSLDVLVLDLPPGTGDVPLTIAQQLLLDGAVLVSTPQHLSTIDASRGLAMFNKVGVPVIGVVQNMSTFICPSCGTETRVFGGETNTERNRHGCESSLGSGPVAPWGPKHPLSTVPFLGDIPLNPTICEDADRGKPTVVGSPSSKEAEKYHDIASQIMARVGLEEA